MNSSQKTILGIAVFILMICLIAEGVIMSSAIGGKQTWPPSVSNCPDYWIDVCGNGTVCLQKNSGNTLNFGGPTTSCAKYQASTASTGQYGYLPWDGINYGVSSPCNTPMPAANAASSSTS